MKTLTKCILCLLIYSSVSSQANDNTVTFDQLNSNTSAAFVLMGISPTEIARPTNIGEFAASVQEASENLSVLPQNYAVEFPLFAKKLQDLGDKVFFSPITLSAGYAREDLDINTRSTVGVGLKFSFIGSSDANEQSQERSTFLKGYLSKPYNNKQKLHSFSAVDQKSFVNNKIKLDPEGFYADLHAGYSTRLLNLSENGVESWKVGAWINTGYEDICSKNISIYTTVKFFYENINLIDGVVNEMDMIMFDFGAKFLGLTVDDRLELSAEYIYRTEAVDGEADYKLVGNISYDIGNDKNQKLTLTLGRDFDNLNLNDGNLLSLLNFVKSFGNENKP